MVDQGRAAGQSDEASNPSVLPPPLLAWLWPVPLGIVIGVPLLTPLAKGPHQFTVGGGVGGVVGLLVALLVRALLVRRTKSCT